MTYEEIQISKDSELMTEVISLIASYAVENDMSPNETIKTVSENMLGLLKIANFENWEKKTLPSVTPTFPKGATNGDMIKAMLNNSVYELEITEIETVYCEKVVKAIGRSKEKDPNIIGGKNKPLFNCTFKAEWWNAPYKRGNEE